MSSHHIVRENQEPALIVASYHALDAAYFGQLLEWSPTLIANEDTLDFLLAEDLKIDVMFSSRDVVTLPQEDIKILPIKTNFISDALDYLIRHGHKAVNVICDTPDETLTSYCNLITIVMLSHNIRYVYIRQRYEKWKEAGSRIFATESKLKSLVGIKKVAPDTFVAEQDGFIYLEFNTDEYVCIGEAL